MKKNIAFVLPYIPVIPAGGVIVVFKYAEKLVDDGNKVYIYFQTDMIWKNKKTRYPDLVRSIVGNLGTRISPRWYNLDKKVIKKSLFSIKNFRKHDIIIATGIETVENVKKYNKSNTRKYYLIQDYENWGVSDEYVNDSYKLGFENIVISKWLSQLVFSQTNKEPIYIPDGIDTSVFYCKHEKRIEHSIVFQYRSAPDKGCQYALEVIKRLIRVFPDLKVTIISKENKTSLIPSWCEYYQNITLEEVSRLNNRSQIFLCTSINEGFGLPGLEAMACGCALCTTDYLGGREYAINDFNALVSPIKDVDSMLYNLIALFGDPKLRNRIAENGIKTAKDFSLIESYKKLQRALKI